MSRWAEAFAALSRGSDTLDRMRHTGGSFPTVSQSVNSVMAAMQPERLPPKATDRAFATCSESKAELAPTPRLGLPQIQAEPTLLRDGRRLWRFRANSIPHLVSNTTASLMDWANWCGTILLADGEVLIVVERWLSALPPETLQSLHNRAGEVIAALHQQSRLR